MQQCNLITQYTMTPTHQYNPHHTHYPQAFPSHTHIYPTPSLSPPIPLHLRNPTLSPAPTIKQIPHPPSFGSLFSSPSSIPPLASHNLHFLPTTSYSHSRQRSRNGLAHSFRLGRRAACLQSQDIITMWHILWLKRVLSLNDVVCECNQCVKVELGSG